MNIAHSKNILAGLGTHRLVAKEIKQHRIYKLLQDMLLDKIYTFNDRGASSILLESVNRIKSYLAICCYYMKQVSIVRLHLSKSI